MVGTLYTLENLTFAKSSEGGRLFRTSRPYGSPTALVFISHRQTDARSAYAIARTLIDVAEVDVFLAAFDPSLGASGMPEQVTGVIDFGLNACTHLLAVISDNTRGSWWVPYEVGVARNRPVPCGLTLLSTVKDLPEYLRATPIVQDVTGLITWANRQLPHGRLHKGVSPLDFTVPDLPTHRQERIVFTD